MVAITPESVVQVVAGLLAPLEPAEQARTVRLLAERYGSGPCRATIEINGDAFVCRQPARCAPGQHRWEYA
jgi:hypothetical protein